jgi:hypothetical protein
MVTLTITLDDRQAEPLRTEAEREGLSVEDYARRELVGLAERKQKLRAALAETVRDDAELYRRLAQ